MTDGASSGAALPRGYDVEIRHLKERAGRLGELALSMVHDGWSAYRASDLSGAQAVLDRNPQLDHLDEEMEHASIAFLVLRQPAATDLRTAVALLKITTHLDRIGRLGFDMARLTAERPPAEAPAITDLLRAMDDAVEAMVRQALEALARNDTEQARALFRRDDAVDGMYRQATRAIIAEMSREPAGAARLAGHLLVTRHFERIADNACKIAEKTIYAISGQRRSEYLPVHPHRPLSLEPNS